MPVLIGISPSGSRSHPLVLREELIGRTLALPGAVQLTWSGTRFLHNELQKQKRTIEEQREQIATLRKEKEVQIQAQQKLIEALEARLAVLEAAAQRQ